MVVLLVALVVLGPEQLPKAARQLGQALREIRKFSNAMQNQVNTVINAGEENPPVSAPAPSSAARPDVERFEQIDEVLDTRPILPPDDKQPPSTEEDPPSRGGTRFR